jgi:hypothetical protein
MEAQKTLNSQRNPEQKEQCCELSWYPASNYTMEPHYKTAGHWHKNRHADRWSRTEDPKTNPHRYSHLIFNKGAQNIHWRKDSLINKWC